VGMFLCVRDFMLRFGTVSALFVFKAMPENCRHAGKSRTIWRGLFYALLALSLFAITLSESFVALAQDGQSGAIVRLVENLIRSIDEGGGFSEDQFRCSAMPEQSGSSRLVMCQDPRSGVSFLWIKEPNSDNVSISVVFAEQTNGIDESVSKAGDPLVKDYRGFQDLLKTFEVLKQEASVQKLQTCSIEEGAPADMKAASVLFAVRNPRSGSRVTLFFSGVDRAVSSEVDWAKRFSDGDIVATVLVLNQLKVPCVQDQ
jgi:hypothetical protein